MYFICRIIKKKNLMRKDFLIKIKLVKYNIKHSSYIIAIIFSLNQNALNRKSQYK